MPKEREEFALVFKYTIRIGDNQTNFLKIRRDLVSGLVQRFGYNDYQELEGSASYSSIPYRFILDNFKTRFRLPGLSQAYLSDYTERNGSLEIEFTAVVISLITNYGSIRETADYFAEDIARMFSIAFDTINAEYNIKTNVKHDEFELGNHYNAAINSSSMNNSTMNKKLFGAYFLSFLSLLISLFFASQNYFRKDEEKQESSSKLDEYKLSKMISDEIRSQKIDDHLKSKSDTVYILRSH
jgi:hypothetical protein